jgi:adenine/guanine phosphoribosyltransferase-like PRPP-binding protein
MGAISAKVNPMPASSKENVGPVIIRFPSRLSSDAFEILLKNFYRPSLRDSEIHFDLTEVVWSDIACLSLAAVWLSTLVSEGKIVSMTYPEGREVCKFLDTYAFTSLVRSLGIVIDSAVRKERRAVPGDLPNARLFPLTFFSEESFVKLMNDLSDGGRLRLVFGDLVDAEVVGSGAIRDVVVYELVSNIFDHAQGVLGHMIMTKASAPVIRSRRSGSGDTQSLRDAEVRYLSKLDGGIYITIVIGDRGPGIKATLAHEYSKYLTRSLELAGTEKGFSECDVLNYSFQYSATRRTKEERLRRISEALKSNLDISPATGLHGLQQIVKYFGGYLQLRSGKSIICYDYLGRDGDAPVFVSDDIEGYRILAPLGGVQFKVYLPVALSARWRSRRYAALREAGVGSSNNLSSYYVSLKLIEVGLKSEPEILVAVQDKVLDLRRRRRTDSWIMLVDLEGSRGLSTKAAHYLLHLLLDGQQDGEVTLVYGAQKPLVISLWGEGRKQSLGALGKALVVVDEAWSVFFMGRYGLQNASHVTSDSSEFVQRWNRLSLPWSKAADSDLESDVRTATVLSAREGAKAILANMILSSENEVYDSSTHVRLPSGAYCEGFFDLTRMYGHEMFSHYLGKWIKIWAIELEATAVVCIGSSLGDILNTESFPVRIISLPFRRRPLPELRSQLGLLSKDRVILLTDVLGTGTTVRLALEAMKGVHLVEVFAVVDASQASLEGGASPLRDAAVRRAVLYFSSLPEQWDISTLREIDPGSRRLVYPRREEVEPLWKSISFPLQEGSSRVFRQNRLFSDLASHMEVVSRGHYLSDNRHITFLFNIASFARFHSEEIAEVIRDDVETVFASREVEPNVSVVFYASYNPGMEEIARRVALEFSGAIVSAVSREDLGMVGSSETSRRSGGAAIVVDDAFESGETTFLLVDMVEAAGFDLILVYPLIRRGGDGPARRLQRIRRYGDASLHIQFLAEATIPTYSEQTCPVCENLREWARVDAVLGACRAAHILSKTQMEFLIPKSVAAISNEQLMLPLPEGDTDASLLGELRWRLEVARMFSAERDFFLGLFDAEPREGHAGIACLRLLCHERFIENLGSKEALSYFSESLRKSISKYILKMLRSSARFSASDVDCALCVLLLLEPDSFMGRWAKLALDYLGGQSDELAWLMSLLLRKRSQVPSIQLILHSLGTLDKRCDDSDEKRDMIDAALRYWRNEQDELNRMRADRVAVYRDLIGGRLHEVSHLKEELVGRTRDRPIDLDAIVRSWSTMEQEMRERIFPLIRQFGRNEMGDPIRTKFYGAFDALRFQLEEGRSIIDELSRGREMEGELICLLADNLESIATRAEALIFGESGLRSILNGYRQDVHGLIHAVMQQRQDDLRARGIRIRSNLPEESCFVYGESVPLRQVLHIAIDNIIEHSRAERLLVDVRINADAGRVYLGLYDDGKGFRGPVRSGEGFKRAQLILSAYSGTIRARWRDDDIPVLVKSAGYSSGAMLNLVYLPVRRKAL